MGKRRSTLRKTKKTVFLDSSVLFTAVNSPFGGSSKLFTIRKIKLVTSKMVLTEVERNVRKKLQKYHLNRLFTLVDRLEILKQGPSVKAITAAGKIIVKKDAAILAEAKQSHSNYLVTLDKKHFIKPGVEKYLNPQKVLTAKMLLKEISKKK